MRTLFHKMYLKSVTEPLPEFDAASNSFAVDFRVKTIRTTLKFKFYQVSTFFLKQLTLHRVYPCFLHLRGFNHQSIFAEANSKIIIAFCGIRESYSC